MWISLHEVHHLHPFISLYPLNAAFSSVMWCLVVVCEGQLELRLWNSHLLIGLLDLLNQCESRVDVYNPFGAFLTQIWSHVHCHDRLRCALTDLLLSHAGNGLNSFWTDVYVSTLFEKDLRVSNGCSDFGVSDASEILRVNLTLRNLSRPIYGPFVLLLALWFHLSMEVMNSQSLLSWHHLRLWQLFLIVLVVKRSSAILDEHFEVKIGFDSKHGWL